MPAPDGVAVVDTTTAVPSVTKNAIVAAMRRRRVPKRAVDFAMPSQSVATSDVSVPFVPNRLIVCPPQNAHGSGRRGLLTCALNMGKG